jgi:hypothetical protein
MVSERSSARPRLTTASRALLAAGPAQAPTTENTMTTPTTAAMDSHSTTLRGKDQRPVEARVGGRFFRLMSAICLAIAVVGFMPTYFLPMAQGGFKAPPIIHIHGLLFFAWMILFCSQTWLVGHGKILAHREWGVLGAALTSAMVFSVVTVTVVRMNGPNPSFFGTPPATWGMITSMAFFAGFVTVGLANVRRPEVHKAAMLVATVSLLSAAVGRWVSLFAPKDGSLPPLGLLLVPGLTVELLIVAAMVYDRRMTGRLSRVYLTGLVLNVILPLTMPIGFTPAWLPVADWIKHLGG